MRRPFRALAGLLAIVSFLFAQAATAAFACANPAPDPVAMAQMKAQMGPDGGLCEKHCASGTVSLEATKPAPSPPPTVAQVPSRIVELPRAAPTALQLRAELLSLAGPAPPLIRCTVLRI